ncbi:hypothetical protein ZWY2020_031900 [Hordeum vulgare]|nr:hypothetical protein ZWY2020_031900 [Hordeum vulgare]
MGDGDRGFRGGRRGEPGRGAREPGPAPGRGGGRGGDRKFSWKRDDGGNNNSSTSNVASGSDDTSRWEEAAMGKQTAEGGIWVPKSQGSSGSAGEGTERQISTPLRRNQGPKVNQSCCANLLCGPRVAFACGVWTDLTCPLKPAYRHAAVSKHKAGASTVNFANNPEAARRQINAWVAEVTGNLIGSVLGPGSITKLTRVVLGNVIYFKGQWEDPFDKEATVNKPFHRLDGRTVDDVPFMRSWSSQFIAVHQGFKVLELRYQMAQAQGNPSRPTSLDPFNRT